MSFNWAEYLDVAYELVGITVKHPAGQEAHQRAAISRAYYAAYKTALNVAKSRDRYVAPTNAGVHRQLIDHFANSTDVSRQDIARDLKELLEFRRAADYNDFMAPRVLARNTTIGLQLATHLLAKLARL
ncbi:MAG: hypothetical protein M3Z04_07940 [Chloroflexota bacterium]|nr:hypothetical protein [Chloroflexota bacterium]